MNNFFAFSVTPFTSPTYLGFASFCPVLKEACYLSMDLWKHVHMQKFHNSQSNPVLFRFCHVSVRPSQEKTLQWYLAFIHQWYAEVKSCHCSVVFFFMAPEQFLYRMRCTIACGSPIWCSHCRRNNLSSHLSLSFVFLYASIFFFFQLGVEERFFRFFLVLKR